MDIRPYTPSDRDACLEVLDSTAPDLRAAFESFLDKPAGSFYVAEKEGVIAGCAGFETRNGAARLHWVTVRKKWQRHGLGRFLLFFCLREITRNTAVEMVDVESPREAAGFFQNQGFKEAGGDEKRTVLVKRLAVCN